MSIPSSKREWKGIEVTDYVFPENQYYKTHTQKTQVCLHHLASGQSTKGDIDWWLSNRERVATCVLVARDGSIDTLFSSKHWAHHLGVKIKAFDKEGIERVYRTRSNGKRYVANNEILNQLAIGCEIDNWGQLTKKNGRFYSWTNTEVPYKDVQVYDKPYRGHKYYEKYTDAQIESTRQLLIYWRDTYGIDTTYKGDRIFDVCKDALQGANGVFTHTSYRSDKSDCHPDPSLINMLRRL